MLMLVETGLMEIKGVTLQLLTKCGPAVLAEESSDLVGNTLGASEDQDLVGLAGAGVHELLEMPDHPIAFLGLGDNFDDLGDTMVRGEIHGADVDLDEIGEEIGSEGANFLGPGSRPHESLTVGANLANNLADLRLEAHVQHAVGLVKNQIGNSAEVSPSRLEHVNQPSRSGDTNLDAAGQVSDLGAFGNTSVDTGVANAGGLSELGNLLLDLDSQFTSGCEDQDNWAIAGVQKGLSVDVNNGGKAVGQSLSGSGLGNTDNVPSSESHGPTLRLDSSRGREALGLHLVNDIAGESSLVEGLNGPRDVVACDGNSMVTSELFDLGGRTVRNKAVLLVERLLELGEGTVVPSLLLEAGTEVGHAVTATTTSVTAATASVTAAAATVAAAAARVAI